jgi:hypothetical protein
MGSPSESYWELEQFDNSFKPKGQTAGVDALPDGFYVCEVVDAGFVRTPKQQELLYKLHCRVLTGPYEGTVVERTSFLRTQDNLDHLGGDLKTLGFDTEKWGAAKGRPIAKELESAAPKLLGVRFAGKKDTTTGTNGKDFHNLRINSLIKPGQPLPTPMPPSRQHVSGNADEIVFGPPPESAKPAPVAAGSGTEQGGDVPF